MHRALGLFALALGCTIALPAMAQQLLGSGSTFVYPIMAKWAAAYEKISGVHVAYQPIGSSGGITEIKAGVVDFGASDAPLSPEQLSQDGLARVSRGDRCGRSRREPRRHRPRSASLHRPAACGHLFGQSKELERPAVAAVNAGTKLPDRAITVIHRSDGSGTTFNWVDYLSKVSSEWKMKVGANTSVAWPVGASGRGNGGVADDVIRVKGAIGYVEFAYVQQKRLVYGCVQNRAGNFVEPNVASFEAATQGADWEKIQDFYVLLDNSSSADAYPIVATSFVLMHKQSKDAERNYQTLAFFRWALANGQEWRLARLCALPDAARATHRGLLAGTDPSA